jgi:hypothetical protein
LRRMAELATPAFWPFAIFAHRANTIRSVLPSGRFKRTLHFAKDGGIGHPCILALRDICPPGKYYSLSPAIRAGTVMQSCRSCGLKGKEQECESKNFFLLFTFIFYLLFTSCTLTSLISIFFQKHLPDSYLYPFFVKSTLTLQLINGSMFNKIVGDPQPSYF